jgi:hypothetical protein
MKRLLVGFASLAAVLAISFNFVAVGAVDVLEPTCQHFSGDKPGICQDNEDAQNAGDDLLFGPKGILTIIINIFSLVLGVAAVIVIFIASVRFITSNGDPQTIATSRNTIIFAILGLALASLAQLIVRLVLTKIGG